MPISSHATQLLSTKIESSEQWIQLLPSGTFMGRDGRGPYKAHDAEGIVKKSLEYAGTSLIAIDYEHQIDNAPKNGMPAPAAGWIKGLQAREDGIYAWAEWTEKAKERIENKEYLYISPVFIYDKVSGEIKKILRAALTNSPNLDMKALACSMDQFNSDYAEVDLLTQLRAILGLPESTDQSEILQKISDMIENHTAKMSHEKGNVVLTDIEKMSTDLHLAQQKFEQKKADMIITQAMQAGRLPPSMKNFAKSLSSTNMKQFEEFIEKMPVFIEPGPLHTEPAYASKKSLSEHQVEVCRAMGHDPKEYLETMSIEQ